MSAIHLRLFGGIELSGPGSEGARRLPLPSKPLALLAYLAVAGPRPVRRDLLLALFWPELPTDRARAALRQLLFQIRRTIGADALCTDRDSVALAPQALWCDVVAFEQLLDSGQASAAMELYRGTLLEGFFVDGMAEELEEWMQAERARLQRKAFLACWKLTEEAERSRNAIEAAQWARVGATVAPGDEIAVRRLIEILGEFGDRAGALRVADDFGQRLEREFGSTPSAETEALVAAVRARCSAPAAVVDIDRNLRTPDNAPPAETETSAPPAERTAPTSAATRADVAAGRGPLPRPAVAAVLAVAATLLLAGGAALARGVRDDGLPTVRAAGVGSPAVTIGSPVARRLYDVALDRYRAGDPREGARLFGAALAEDSTCAICAYYASLASAAFDDSAAATMLERAMRLAGRVSEPERLLIHFRWADATNSPSRTMVADSLASRYPRWPEAQLAAAEALTMEGAYLDAVAHLRRAIRAEQPLDSGSRPHCATCDARLLLVSSYEAADSLPAALRAAEAAVHAQPHSRIAWLLFSHVLAELGRYDDARAALDTSTHWAAGTDDDVMEHAEIEIRAGNFATADRLLSALAETGNGNSRSDALWWELISLRDQGRLREALALAEGPMRWAEAASTQGVGNARVAEAQVLFELGRYREAADLFAAAAWPEDSFARAALGRVARQRVWMLTHAGSALAAAGDTIALADLADTVEGWGRKSGFGRDQRMHEYLRGLLWTARGRPDEAVAAYRHAVFSETEGFSRLNLEMARTFLALGRPREAIPLLRHALGGTLEAGGFYATPSELQETLARAYDAAGEADSAGVYYRSVIRAWRDADAQFQPLVAHARARLALGSRRLVAQR